jgi:hypothetical protein
MQVSFGAVSHGYKFYGSHAGKDAATTAKILRNIENNDIVPGSIKEVLNTDPPFIIFSTYSDGATSKAKLNSELAQGGRNYHMIQFNPDKN